MELILPIQVITNLVKMLKSRDTRRNFCPPNHWLSEQENIKADKVILRGLLNFFLLKIPPPPPVKQL